MEDAKFAPVTRFMYQIHPRRPIRNLIPGQCINRPMSMKLTKDEALECIKFGPVFRTVPGRGPIRVTGSNIDELHKEQPGEVVSEEASNSTKTEEKPQIQPTVVTEPPKTEAPSDVKVEESGVEAEPEAGEVKEETPAEPEKVEEKEPAEDSDEEEIVASGGDEESDEEDTSEEIVVDEGDESEEDSEVGEDDDDEDDGSLQPQPITVSSNPPRKKKKHRH